MTLIPVFGRMAFGDDVRPARDDPLDASRAPKLLGDKTLEMPRLAGLEN